jgi:subtilase family serine protease
MDYLPVIADSNNAISESNETNNERSEPLPDVEQADLIIEALTWTPSNFSDGQVVTFTVSVGNIGPGNTTRGFYARFMIDDAQIGEKYISGILSGSSIDRVQVWPATPGEHTVKVIVDSHSQVTESNESNNEAVCSIQCVH